MVSLSLYQAYALDGGGFSPKSLLGLSANLDPPLLWRLSYSESQNGWEYIVRAANSIELN